MEKHSKGARARFHENELKSARPTGNSLANCNVKDSIIPAFSFKNSENACEVLQSP